MDVTINAFAMAGIILVGIVTGFFIGRREKNLLLEEETEASAEQRDGTTGEREHAADRRHRNEIRHIPQGKSIASPVAGEVRFFCEGGRRGAVIEPEQGMVYAPASGKITKMYPMGNAFLMRMDDQREFLIQVGKHPDELCSMYYRPRIVQNEIVNKGKLLLTFDKERLQAAGEDVSVTVSLEDGIIDKEIVVTQKERVKVGDELLKTY